MDQSQIINWLLKGDISICYQTNRDILGIDKKNQRNRISKEGWGAKFLACRNENGQWGRAFYQPKWISTHYTLLDLKNLAISPTHKDIKNVINKTIVELKGDDGGILCSHSQSHSDVCVNGMFLNYAAYFGIKELHLKSIVDFLLTEHMVDGGFNCYSNSKGAIHSSLHSTLSVIEGILEYARHGYSYRLAELQSAELRSREFILQHKLYRSSRTGAIIDKKMMMLSFPSRWKYDILRVLDYFRDAGMAYDQRMDDAIQVILKKRRRDGCWPLQARHSGETHFEMEKAGQASRWNTLRALRVLQHFAVRI